MDSGGGKKDKVSELEGQEGEKKSGVEWRTAQRKKPIVEEKGNDENNERERGIWQSSSIFWGGAVGGRIESREKPSNSLTTSTVKNC